MKFSILDYFPIYLSNDAEKYSLRILFLNNLEGDSITANHRDNLPVLYKYGAMLFCWDIRLNRVIAVWKSYSLCLQFLYLLNCIMVVQAHWKLSKNYKTQVRSRPILFQWPMRCTINSKINGTPKGVYLPIQKIHSILAVVANLLVHSNLWYIIMHK